MSLFRLGLLCLMMLSAPVAVVAADEGNPVPAGAKLRLGNCGLRGVSINTMTPDGKYLATTQLGGISLLDPRTGKVVQTRKAAPGVLGPLLAFSQDGKRAVSGVPGNVSVWEVETGAVLLRIQKHISFGENCVSITPNGKRIAVGVQPLRSNQTTSVEVWDVDQKKSIGTFTTLQNQFVYVALSPDGKRLATWGTHVHPPGKFPKDPAEDPGRTLQLWDTSTGKEIAKVHTKAQPVAVIYSPTGSYIAISSGDGSISVLDPDTGKSRTTLVGRSGQGLRLDISPDEKAIASSGGDGVIQRWSLADGKLLGTYEPPFPYFPRAIRFTDNEKAVAWGNNGSGTFVWEVPSGKPISPLGGHFAHITGISISEDSKEVITSSHDGVVIRWDLATGRELGSSALKWEGHVFQFSADGKYALRPESKGTGIYEVATGVRSYLPSDNVPFRNATFSTDGKHVVEISKENQKGNSPKVTVWSIPDSKELGSVSLPSINQPGLSAVAATITPDGKKLITAANKGETFEFAVTCWDLAPGKKLAEYTEPAGSGLTSVFLAATGDNGTAIVVRERSPWVVVIDPAAGKIVKTLDIGSRPPIAPVLSPDRKSVALATTGMVFLVDLESGTINKSLPTGGSSPSVLSFSTDGKMLFFGSHDTTVLVWDVAG